MYNPLLFTNTSGITVPLTALRTKNDFGIGDLEDAYLFVDFLAKSGFTIWKMLPVNTTLISGFNSPYDAESAFALDPLFLDLTDLEDIDYEHVKTYLDLIRGGQDRNNTVEFERCRKIKSQIQKLAFYRFYRDVYNIDVIRTQRFNDFILKEAYWLDEYALFKTLQKEFGEIFLGLWPKEFFHRNPEALEKYRRKNEEELLYNKYCQWIIHVQWMKLKTYANEKGVSLIGDIPSFIEAGSADVWSQRHLFHVNENLLPTVFGGAPPDQLSVDGQVWQMISTDWEAQKKEDYMWWRRRFEHMSDLFDGLRLDYFMIYVEYWSIEPGKKAIEGDWKKGPGMDFLNTVIKDLSDRKLCKFIAEVPTIDQEVIVHVHDVLAEIGSDLCVILAFDYKHFLKEEMENGFTVETSTHDTPPIKVLWKKMSDEAKAFLLNHLGIDYPLEGDFTDQVRWDIIKAVLSLPVHAVIFPIQDILGTNEQINIPGLVGGDNWAFRLKRYIEDMLVDEELIARLNEYTDLSKRNKGYRDFFMRSVPVINGKTARRYTVGEEIIVWSFAEFEGVVEVVTNLPTKDNLFSDIKTIYMDEVQRTDVGTLYRWTTTAIQCGTYFLTMKQGERYISGFEQNLTLYIDG